MTPGEAKIVEDMGLAILGLAKKFEDIEIRLGILRERLDRQEEMMPVVADPWPLLDTAWGLIANVSDGDWDRADVSSEWKKAAEHWRDKYLQALKARR